MHVQRRKSILIFAFLRVI